MNTNVRVVPDGFNTATPRPDRSGLITDPFGHKWTIATHKEEVSPEEMRKRAAALFGMS